MNEHKKTHSFKNDIIADYHEYTDGVHKGTGYTQDLADQAYQQAKREDKDHIHYTVDPDTWDSFLWNNDGDKIDRGGDDDSSSSSSSENSDSGCFITTACIKAKGLNDNCEELQILRNFRDGYVRNLGTGIDQINQYYQIAPVIVTKINGLKNSIDIWKNVYKEIETCIVLINNHKNSEALERYKETVISLKYL